MPRRRDQIDDLTRSMRSGQEPLWTSVRLLLRERGVDPDGSLLAEFFPDDSHLYFGIVVTPQGRAIQFDLELPGRESKAAALSHWEDVTEAHDSPHSGIVEAALFRLEREGGSIVGGNRETLSFRARIASDDDGSSTLALPMRPTSLVPMAYVRSVRRAVAFYHLLGFEEGNRHTPDGQAEPVWAWLKSGGAQLMLSAATEPVEPEKQAVLFYLYCDDVAAFREQLIQAGVEAGPIQQPFWAPGGEFRVVDPDGYVLMISHT